MFQHVEVTGLPVAKKPKIDGKGLVAKTCLVNCFDTHRLLP